MHSFSSETLLDFTLELLDFTKENRNFPCKHFFSPLQSVYHLIVFLIIDYQYFWTIKHKEHVIRTFQTPDPINFENNQKESFDYCEWKVNR